MTVAGTPYLIGSNTPSTAILQLVTTSTATTPGDTVTICIGLSGNSDTVSIVSDSVGNTYSLVSSNVAVESVYTYQAVNANYLPSGSTVGVLFVGTANTKDVTVIGCTGLASVDLSPTASGTSTAPTVSGTPSKAVPETVLVALAHGTATVSAPTYTILATQANLSVGYQVTTSYSSTTASATLSGSVGWGITLLGMVPVVYPPPSVPVFAPGLGALASNFDTWVQQPLGFFSQTSVFRATRAAAQSLNNGTNTIIAFDTILEDPTGGWNGTNAWVAPWDGFYEITFSYLYANATNTYANAFLLINGATQINLGGTSSASGTEGCYITSMTGTDSIQAIAFVTTTGVSTATAVGQQPSIEITFVTQ